MVPGLDHHQAISIVRMSVDSAAITSVVEQRVRDHLNPEFAPMQAWATIAPVSATLVPPIAPTSGIRATAPPHCQGSVEVVWVAMSRIVPMLMVPIALTRAHFLA